MGTLSHESAICNSVSSVALVHSLPAGNSDPFRKYRCYPFAFMSMISSVLKLLPISKAISNDPKTYTCSLA
jgi:hypothetical protein